MPCRAMSLSATLKVIVRMIEQDHFDLASIVCVYYPSSGSYGIFHGEAAPGCNAAIYRGSPLFTNTLH